MLLLALVAPAPWLLALLVIVVLSLTWLSTFVPPSRPDQVGVLRPQESDVGPTKVAASGSSAAASRRTSSGTQR